MNKTQQAKNNIQHLGYTIEYCVSPRGNKLCKAIKEGHKTLYATNPISLNKLIDAEVSKSLSKIPVKYGAENKAWAEVGYNH